MHGCFRSFSFLQIVGPLFLCAKEKVFQLTCITCPLRGSIWRRCGSLWRSSAPFRPGFTPTFAPKRQGNAPGAYRRPRLRPSFGQPEGIGRPIPLWGCNNRYIPNRRTKQEQSQARLNYVLQGGGRATLNPSATDFCVLKDTARCPLSYSKGFGLLPKRPCPMRGGASSPKSGSLFLPAVRLPKLRLCRDTTKSIVI